MTGSWQPIIDAGDKAAAEEAIDAVTADLRTLDPSSTELQEQLDLSVYFGYLGRARGDARDRLSAGRWLDAAIAQAESRALHHGLYGGTAALGWTLEHLEAIFPDPSGSEDPADDPNDEIDAVLIEAVGDPTQIPDYDLISGAVGVGVYFLERMPRETARRGLEAVLDRLATISVATGEGRTWFTPPQLLPPWQRERCPNGYVNFGVAHGVPGVIALLSHCVTCDVARPVADRLLESAMAELLARKQPSGAGWAFPHFLRPDEPSGTPSRVAWCYGDPGVAFVILTAASAMGREDWWELSLQVMTAALCRPEAAMQIWDAGLCHGAVGLGHVCNHFFQVTGVARFADDARKWLNAGRRMRQPGQGVGGFQMYEMRQQSSGESNFAWVKRPGILTGSAGISLAFLAAISPIAPRWDRRLLLSFPSVASGLRRQVPAEICRA